MKRLTDATLRAALHRGRRERLDLVDGAVPGLTLRLGPGCATWSLILRVVGEGAVTKRTLREWRREFARHLRDQGVAANATERAVRGETKPQKTDGIHRAALRGASTHYRRKADLVARELASGGIKPEPGKYCLLATRREVVRGWSEVADNLVNQGQVELALTVRRFVDRMPPPSSEKEW
ncbi:MAG: hypothetical protein PVS2B1_13140 [Candidatus Dormibacteraceae bacterium]